MQFLKNTPCISLMNINITLKFMLKKFLRALKIAYILTKGEVDNA